MKKVVPENMEFIVRGDLKAIQDVLCERSECQGICSNCIFDATLEEFSQWLTDNLFNRGDGK